MEKKMEISIKKSMLKAEGEIDYKRICFPLDAFIPCSYTEEAEELQFCFDLSGQRSLRECTEEGEPVKLAVLLDLAGLYEISLDYRFSLSPDNLYYDRYSRVRILQRDVYEQGSQADPLQFLKEYKSLAGSLLQRKYSFEDFMQGGEELYAKNRLLTALNKQQNTESIAAILEEEYNRLDTERRQYKIQVDKRIYKRVRYTLSICGILLLLCAGGLFYYQGLERPREQAMLQATNAYLNSDYTKVIDTLLPVALEQIYPEQKYILAAAYIRSENLTREQKDNIVATIGLNSDEQLKNYWIQIGRLNVVEAENIAMQRSDDELLLYACMKEKNLIETDTEMDGEEKASKLKELESKISELSKVYQTEDEDK